MSNQHIISPLDNRYNNKVQELAANFSETHLNKVRYHIEVDWLIFLCENGGKSFPKLSKSNFAKLQNIRSSFNTTSAKRIKSIEQQTNHDVKAVEYFIREKLAEIPSLKKYEQLVHFALTSEDINSLSYAILLRDAISIYLKKIKDLTKALNSKSKKWSGVAMLSRTHGQAASPTTIGKEIKVFCARLERQIAQLTKQIPMAKFGGATGNFHTLHLVDSKVDWVKKTNTFLKTFKIQQNSITTQIEPHDGIAEIAQCVQRINNVIIDFDQDMWLYISNDVFKLELKDGEVGSSTMPHKVNPIDFENSEGNLGLSNSLMSFFADKLTKSRLQRDLSDSTVLRNLGVAFGYSYLGITSALNGFAKVSPNKDQCLNELNNNWQILAEAIQTVMKIEGIDNAYEIIKEQTRGVNLDQVLYLDLVSNLQISNEAKLILTNLTPSKYVGIAEKLAKS